MSLWTSYVLTDEYNAMVNSEELPVPQIVWRYKRGVALTDVVLTGFNRDSVCDSPSPESHRTVSVYSLFNDASSNPRCKISTGDNISE